MLAPVVLVEEVTGHIGPLALADAAAAGGRHRNSAFRTAQSPDDPADRSLHSLSHRSSRRSHRTRPAVAAVLDNRRLAQGHCRNRVLGIARRVLDRCSAGTYLGEVDAWLAQYWDEVACHDQDREEEHCMGCYHFLGGLLRRACPSAGLLPARSCFAQEVQSSPQGSPHLEGHSLGLAAAVLVSGPDSPVVDIGVVVLYRGRPLEVSRRTRLQAAAASAHEEVPGRFDSEGVSGRRIYPCPPFDVPSADLVGSRPFGGCLESLGKDRFRSGSWDLPEVFGFLQDVLVVAPECRTV